MTVRKVLSLQNVNTPDDLRRALSDIENAINRLANPEVATDGTTADTLGGGAAGGGLVSVGPEGPTGPAGPQGIAGPKGQPGPGYTRGVISFGTGVLASGAREQGQFSLAQRGDLLIATSNQMARLILYQTAAARTADLGRSLGTSAPLGQGIIAEFSWDVGGVAIYASPIPRIINNDIGDSDIVYYTASNRALVSTAIVFQLRTDIVAAA